jgi:hypothetical protein
MEQTLRGWGGGQEQREKRVLHTDKSGYIFEKVDLVLK